MRKAGLEPARPKEQRVLSHCIIMVGNDAQVENAYNWAFLVCFFSAV